MTTCPSVLDPPRGWVQNSNSPPWFATVPSLLDPADFPPYMAPQYLTLREQRGIRMLEENPRMSLDRLVELKYSTRLELADRVLDDLLDAVEQSADASAMAAAEVLAAWDRQAEAASSGTLLFQPGPRRPGQEKAGQTCSAHRGIRPIPWRRRVGWRTRTGRHRALLRYPT